MSIINIYDGEVSYQSGEPSQVLIDEMERLLAGARTGQIQGGVMVMMDRHGEIKWSISGRISGAAIIGGMEMAKNDLISCFESEGG